MEEKKIRGVPLQCEKQPMSTKAKQMSSSRPKTNQVPPRFMPLLKADLLKNRQNKENQISRVSNKNDLSRDFNVRKILHVSNLPEDCCINDLGELFEEYGKVGVGSVEGYYTL